MAAEMLLQYLWEHRLWERCDTFTTDGRHINIIDQGLRNNGSGPDFFNAKIEIDGHMWVGNVEIHVNASDWMRHNHQSDPAYDNVILHVVGNADRQIHHRCDQRPLPTMVLPFTPDYSERYQAMVNNTASSPACAQSLPDIEPIYLTDWLTSLGYERLYQKTDHIANLLARNGNDWHQTAYTIMARALGFSTNSDPMERLAVATPLRALLRHRSEPQMVEAMLFGQAGMLDTPATAADSDDDYIDQLRLNYDFLARKYDLHRLESPGWKTGRIRPANSPMRRIATLAAMVADGFTFGRQFIHIDSEKAARRMLDIHLDGYWINHYNFGQRSVYAPKALSDDSITRLIVNAVVPLLYAYGLQAADDNRCNLAIEILEQLPAESNSIITTFENAGIPCHDAFTSQSLIQLRRAYCEPRKCLFCRIGHRILAARARPNPFHLN